MTTARARLLAPLWGLAGLLFAAPLAAALDYPEGSAIDWLGFDDAPFEQSGALFALE